MRRRPGFTLIECCVAVWVAGVALLALAAALAAAHRIHGRVVRASLARGVSADDRERRLAPGCPSTCAGGPAMPDPGRPEGGATPGAP